MRIHKHFKTGTKNPKGGFQKSVEPALGIKPSRASISGLALVAAIATTLPAMVPNFVNAQEVFDPEAFAPFDPNAAAPETFDPAIFDSLPATFPGDAGITEGGVVPAAEITGGIAPEIQTQVVDPLSAPFDPSVGVFDPNVIAADGSFPAGTVAPIDPYTGEAVAPVAAEGVNLGGPVSASLEYITEDGELPIQVMSKGQILAAGKPVYRLYSKSGEYHEDLAACSLASKAETATYDCNHSLYGSFVLHARKVSAGVEFYHSNSKDIEFGSQGGYLSGEGASAFGAYVSARGLGALETTYTTPLTATLSVESTTGIGYGGSIAAGLRYRVGGFANLRAELEGSYRQLSVVETKASDGFPSTNPSGTITTATGMANLMMELLPKGRFNPYFGGGVGYSNYTFGDLTETGSVFLSGDATALTYQALGGARFKLMDKVSMFGEYRYVSTPEIEIASKTGEIGKNGLNTHEIAMGVTFDF